MNKELAVMDEHTIVISDLKKSKEMCQLLMQSPHYAKMGEAGIFAISQKAKSIGYNVLDALNGAFYYVNGRVGMGSETMAAIIRSKGHSIIKDPKSSDTCCILHGKRIDNGDTWTSKFDLEDAKRAGLLKNVYNSYPGVMLYNRAMALLARQLFPDVIKNAGYCKEELSEITRDETPAEVTAEVISDKITEEEAEELSQIIADCSEEHQKKIRKYLEESGWQNLHIMPKTAFSKIKELAVKRRQDYLDASKEINGENQAYQEVLEAV